MLAFVEGSMERHFVESNFRYVRIVPVHNGITWTIDRICQKIVSEYKAFNVKTKVIVWLDREGRNCTAQEFRQIISQALENSGAETDGIHVMVNDIMSENIILADEMVIRNEFGNDEYSYRYEGHNGKHIIKEFYKSQGIKYREMSHGVRLLKKIRLSRSASTSNSVRAFLDEFGADCWWMTQDNLQPQ